MARSNYKFNKRQKEIARKKKKEEKRQRRLEKNDPTATDTPAEQDTDQVEDPTEQALDPDVPDPRA